MPRADFQYQEQDGGSRWHISGGGSRAYLVRLGHGLSQLDEEEIGLQNADSHFMLSRLLGALLVAGEGHFIAEPAGRIFLSNVEGKPNWFTQLDFRIDKQAGAKPEVYDWIQAFARHTMLRRAAADAHAALAHPVEAGLYVYRGLEWLVVGEGRKWNDLAVDIGISEKEMRAFKKTVNVDGGVRHASHSGQKLRGEFDNYVAWVAGLMDALYATRSRIESTFTTPPREQIALAVAAAVPAEAYM